MEIKSREDKIVITAITLLMLAAGSFSAVRFGAALYAVLEAGGGGLSAYGFLSFFGVAEKGLSALGIFYLMAARLSFANKRDRAFNLLGYTAWAQLTAFSVCFMIFGFFCGPRGALPHLAIAAIAAAIVSIPKFRRAFDSDTAIFKKSYKAALTAFLCVIGAHCLFIGYFAVSYPHLFAPPRPVVDFSLSGAAGPDGPPKPIAGDVSSGTTEIFGFKLALPPGFQLSKKVREAATESAGAYDKAIFSCGSDQIILTTKNGILIEQLFSMTAIFDIPDSYDFYTKYIDDRFGAVWLSSKSFLRYEYTPFTAGRWRGYIEAGPMLPDGRYLAKSFNLWSRDTALPARLELTFFFKNGGPPDDLAKSVLSSLEGRGWPF